ncbi:MAG: large conductance mechanosensitive channel protein MscL [Clostridia bacterium]|nr:large conductance mechanosensitive channel protein MscL [Clostridia bacterium]
MGAEDKKVIDEKIEQSEKERKKEEKKKRREQRKKDRVSFFADFKKFITKGNVLDMAVGVVIGSAFTAIVNGLVKNIINPCIARITGSSDMSEWKTIIQKEVVEGDAVVTPEIAILWGDWLQTIINFFIIAFSVFVAVSVIKKADRMMNAREI